MNNEEKFKNKVKGLLDEPYYAYDAGNWDTASKHLDAEDKKRRRFFYFLFTGLGLGLALFTFLLYTPSGNNNPLKAIHTTELTHSTPTNDTLPKQNSTEKNQITSGTVTQKPATGGNLDSDKKTNTKLNSPSVELPGTNADQESGKTSVNLTKITKLVSSNPVAATVVPNQETKSSSDPEIKTELAMQAVNVRPNSTSTKSGNVGILNNVNAQSKENSDLTQTPIKTKINPNDSTENLNKSPQEIQNPVVVMNPEIAMPALSSLKDSITKKDPLALLPDTMTKTLSQPTVQTLASTNYCFVEAGAYFNLGWSYHGSREGMGIDPYLGMSYLSKLNNKLSFTIGAYYSSLSNLKLDTKVIKNTVVVFGEESSVTAITPIKVNYFLVPLKMQYALNENQAFTAGCTIGYLLDVQSKVETYKEDYTGIQDYKNYHTGGYVEGFKTFNTQLNIGYRRRLYKQVWLNSEVLFGLSDIRENTFFGMTIVERLTGLKISLSYDLIKK